MTEPLEVVSLLSRASLELLQQEVAGVQQFVLETITCCINQWEAQKVVLDPITREAVLDSLVAIHIATAKGLTQLLISAREEHHASCAR
jgi:hypothetical protein